MQLSRRQWVAPAAGVEPPPPAPHAALKTSVPLPKPLQLLGNFIYKDLAPENFTTLSGAIDAVRFLCSRDLTIAQVGARRASRRLRGAGLN